MIYAHTYNFIRKIFNFDFAFNISHSKNNKTTLASLKIDVWILIIKQGNLPSLTFVRSCF